MTEILRMNHSHVAQVAQLETLCFRDPWSERSIAGELDNPLSTWLICADGDAVLGYVGSQTVMGETDMMNVAVHPAARGQGIATRLILALVEDLKKQGSHCLTLEVRASNQNAISLYQKLGFLQIGRRPNYYRNPKEDALILRKEWEN